MAECVRPVYFVMSLCFCFCQVSTACQEGWFGSSCQYKCHCATDRCHINGSCLENDKCQTGWFGANCQFQDLAVNGSVLLVPQGRSDLLQDGDDDTCHHNVNALLLTWKRNYVFSWLRIKMNETGFDFGVMFKPLNTGDTTLKNNDYITCLNQKIYHNGNQIYYVHCNTSESIHEIFLVWQGPRTVCSLNVNAGRNVALKQVAELSSKLDEKSVAGNAVDGNTEGSYHSGSCVHTKEGDPKPSLLVKFAVPAIVDRIVIYNRVDCCQDRLKGFHLQTWTVAGTADIDYTDSIPYAQNIYNVVAPKNRKVITQISLTSQDKKNGLFLSICELQVYGDTFCPPKLFGAECQFHCNCADVNESCDVSTGLCLSGCARGFSGEGCVSCQQGFYGTNCSRECSSGCSNHQCHVDTGKCFTCLSGYQGDFCNQTCSIGSFGENCRHF
ncbi:uncharacterized protein LOC131951592 [Physella acuta]|uniref:uncharacterized protein LOC131951592 n=1 Tax=Physella acuta TaxID=109671 RepID=UPI0027DDEDF4|nr:uncharacterized protein LOC131951592 [Physella acuta]